MGIININSDSFYSGSRCISESDILRTAEKMIVEGAAILDVGAQSTRPGSPVITGDEELKRLLPAIISIKKKFPDSFISVDTYYGKVANEAINAGADLINDISAGTMDETLLDTIAKLNVPYVLMHMQGNQTNMQQSPRYNNPTLDVMDFFIRKIALLREKGINDIIIDPGYGFGKTIEHNFILLQNQNIFKTLECPILSGISRKSFIYKTLKTDPVNALNGTTVLNTISLLNGANILRVHDVKEAMGTITLFRAYQSASEK
jgi:dihydropteroate synthase